MSNRRRYKYPTSAVARTTTYVPPPPSSTSSVARSRSRSRSLSQEDEEYDIDLDLDLDLDSNGNEEQQQSSNSNPKNNNDSNNNKNDYYHCYLLKSLDPSHPLKTYIGYTVNPHRRLRQHNGILKAGGAKRTSRSGRPWTFVCIIGGFRDSTEALKFEWAWQHPKRSTIFRSGLPGGGTRGSNAATSLAKILDSRRGTKAKLQLAQILLCETMAYKNEELSIYFFEKEHELEFQSFFDAQKNQDSYDDDDDDDDAEGNAWCQSLPSQMTSHLMDEVQDLPFYMNQAQKQRKRRRRGISDNDKPHSTDDDDGDDDDDDIDDDGITLNNDDDENNDASVALDKNDSSVELNSNDASIDLDTNESPDRNSQGGSINLEMLGNMNNLSIQQESRSIDGNNENNNNNNSMIWKRQEPVVVIDTNDKMMWKRQEPIILIDTDDDDEEDNDDVSHVSCISDGTIDLLSPPVKEKPRQQKMTATSSEQNIQWQRQKPIMKENIENKRDVSSSSLPSPLRGQDLSSDDELLLPSSPSRYDYMGHRRSILSTPSKGSLYFGEDDCSDSDGTIDLCSP